MRKIIFYIIIIAVVLIVQNCAGSKKFESEENKKVEETKNEVKTVIKNDQIRVLLDENYNTYDYLVNKTVYLLDDKKVIAVVEKGNILKFSGDNDNVILNIKDKTFQSKFFEINSENKNEYIFFNGKAFKGGIKFISAGDSIKAINTISLEEYLRGVIPAEMPVKNGEDYYEALKAFAICARTYAVIKLSNQKNDYDIYLDVRDQVYGGAGAENKIADNAVKDTKGMILAYNNVPAEIYYSSTCGGHTEDAANVFSYGEIPYMKGVVDGDPPYCSISPKFRWTEKFDESTFISRLINYGLLTKDNYKLLSIEIASKFESGRIKQLNIYLNNIDHHRNVKVRIFGNNIRYVIRTADDKNILESNLFDISYSESKVIISGRGYGHGVGLCQWGSIAMARKGFNFDQILEHYFPGTKVIQYND